MSPFELTEKQVRSQIKSFLATQGLYVDRLKKHTTENRNFLWWNVQSLGSYKGLPDMAGRYKKHGFWIEAKKTGEDVKPNSMQGKVIRMLRNHGDQVFVVNDIDKFIIEWGDWVRKLK